MDGYVHVIRMTFKLDEIDAIEQASADYSLPKGFESKPVCVIYKKDTSWFYVLESEVKLVDAWEDFLERKHIEQTTVTNRQQQTVKHDHT